MKPSHASSPACRHHNVVAARTPQRALTALLAATTLLWPGNLPAQETEFEGSVQVRVVEIDVQVTNKAGRPVTGLTIDDFSLFEDGQPVEIEYFFEKPGRRTERRPAAQPAPRQSPVATAPTTQGPSQGPTEPLLVLYLDHLTLLPSDRNRVLRELTPFVGRAVESARVMLVTFDGGLSIVVPPTRDPAPLLAALEAVPDSMTRGGEALRDCQQARSIINEIHAYCMRLTPDSPDCSDCVGRLTDQWRIGAEQEGALTERSAGGLLDLVKTIGGLEGQKSFVYVGSGLARMPGIDLVQYLIDICPARESDFRRASGGYDLGGLLLEVAGLANARRVTLHSLDAGGLRPFSAASVDAPNARYRDSARTSEILNSNLQSGMFTLARETGGRTILNDNRPLDELTGIVETLDHGYSIGFTPRRPTDRRVHRVRVHLTKLWQGYAVSSRRSYVDRQDDDLSVERLLAAVQLGLGDNPMGVRAALGEIERVDKKVIQLPVRIEIPLAQLGAILEGDPTGRALSVLAVAIDSKGRRTVVRRRSVPLPARSHAGQESPAHQFDIRFKLEPDHYRIGISLELEPDGRTSYVVIEADATATP